MDLSLNNPISPNTPPYADWLGFNNVPPAPTSEVPQGQGVLTEPHPSIDASVDHSNTIPYPVPDNGVQGVAGTYQITDQLVPR